MNGISRETYEGLDQDSKLNVLFDYALDSHQCLCEAKGELGKTDQRISDLERKVERRKRFDTSVAAGTGVVGGFIGFLGFLGIDWWRK